MKKKIIIIPLLGLLLSSCLIYSLTNKQDNIPSESSIITNINNCDGILIQIRQSTSNNSYGSQIIKYKISPSSSNTNILYKLNYIDNTNVETDILSISHNVQDKEITITCNKPFTKQIILTLYAENNENINAKIKIDFMEKIDPVFSLQAENNKPLKVNTEISSTGGTIKIDKTIKEEVFTFNLDFLSKLNSYLKEDSYTYFKDNGPIYEDDNYEYWLGEYNSFEKTELEEYYSSIQNISYSASELNSLTSYSPETFLENISATITLKYASVYDKKNDIDIESTNLVSPIYPTITALELSKSHFSELFNGETMIFDYSCKINNKVYKSSFPLKIDTLNLSKINIDNSSLTF